MKYRIRWANVQVANGRYFIKQQRCIAERKTWLGWWPCFGADWHYDEADCERDIAHDKSLRQPLPKPRIIE